MAIDYKGMTPYSREWVYGSAVELPTGIAIIPYGDSIQIITVLPETVAQHTGEIDGDGNKIYISIWPETA